MKSLKSSLSLPNLARVPDHLSTKKLSRRVYLSPATGNKHGLRSEDFVRVQGPLPNMFGDENYAFQIIDIDDPRYVEESMEMSKKLMQLFYDQQIMENEWRKTYKELLTAEQQQATLPITATHRSKETMANRVEKARKYLLTIQDQRDLFRTCIQEIWTRCDEIKAITKKEVDLENLRGEMSCRIRHQYSDDNDFWTQNFSVRSNSPSPKAHPGSPKWPRI